MHLGIGPSFLAVCVLSGAAGIALFQRSSVPSPARASTVAQADELRAPMPVDPQSMGTVLPPNHPPLTANGTDPPLARDESPPALTWSVPDGWEVAPNRSAIRLATYRVPALPKSAAAAELTVTRAGGTTEENLARWAGQFDAAGQDTRAVRTIAGVHLATLEVSGTYEGGMTMGGAETAHPGWALLGAVVETNGPSYFFKMVGPAETVHAARPAFEALLKSLHKTT
jgi:hypothetical protein